MEEPSLRDYLELLWRGRLLIAVVTLASVLAAAAVSLFVLPKVYESSVTLLVAQPPAPREAQMENSIAEMLYAMAFIPRQSAESFAAQAQCPAVLQRVLDSLPGVLGSTSLDQFRGMVRVRADKATGFLTLTVPGRTPDAAAAVADAWAKEYLDFVSEQVRARMARSVEFLGVRLHEEEGNLDRALEELKDFLGKPRGVDELSHVLSTKLSLITEARRRLHEISIQLETETRGLHQAEEELARTPEVLVTIRSIADDIMLHRAAAELSGSRLLDVAGLQMRSEEVNPVRVELLDTIAAAKIEIEKLKAERQATLDTIAVVEKELEGLRGELAGKQVAQEKLQHRVDVLRQACSQFRAKYEETRAAEAASFGEANLVVVSPAFEPSRPSRPRPLLNTAVAGVLGVMVGVFLAFFQHYWRVTAPSARRD